ncbi:uncharacterized protein [Antedon mediterranea]|uniref:uncharacterized protein n=1 Tax=Antedon mediterranea TaxID=105859 RepID=UPI003AF73283
MLAVTMPQGGLVWPFQWSSLMTNKTSPVAMDLTSGSSVDNENATLSQLLEAAFPEDESTTMAPLSGISNTDTFISPPILNMEMNNDLLDLTKPLECLQHGISSMSLDSLNNEHFVDAVEVVQTEPDDSPISRLSGLNSCPDTDVESVEESKKEISKNEDVLDKNSEEKRQLMSDSMQETTESDSVKVSAVSQSPESYSTLYKAFKIAQEEPIDTDVGNKPRESMLDMLNRTSPKLQRVALRKANISPDKHQTNATNEKTILTTLSKHSPLTNSSIKLTWKKFGTENYDSVTTFADILQKKATPSPKNENFFNIQETNDIIGTHWTELMQKKSFSEMENGIVQRRVRKTNHISRPKSLPIQLRHIRRPASRPLKTPEDKKSKTFDDFQFQNNLNTLEEGHSTLSRKTQSAPTPKQTKWEVSTPMDTRTSPSPSSSTLPFYLKRDCRNVSVLTTNVYLQNSNIPLELHDREAPDGISESPTILTSKNKHFIINDDNSDINANVNVKEDIIKSPIDSKIDENTDIIAESDIEVDFDSDISDIKGAIEPMPNMNYEDFSLESVLRVPFCMDASTQQQTFTELYESFFDRNGNSLGKHMLNKNSKDEIIVRSTLDDVNDFGLQDLISPAKTWPNIYTYNRNIDKSENRQTNSWNTFDYLDAEETFLPLEPLPDYADSETFEPVQVLSRSSSTTLSSPSELNAECNADHESFYLSLPSGQGTPTKLSYGHSKRLNSRGDTSEDLSDISSSVSSLSEGCKHSSSASNSIREIPVATKTSNSITSDIQQDYICYRPMRKISEAGFLQHNLQDPVKDKTWLKSFTPSKSISPAQKSSVIPKSETRSSKKNPRLIHDLLEKLKEQALDLELRQLKRTTSKVSTSVPDVKQKEVNDVNYHTNRSTIYTSYNHHLEDTVQYIEHQPLKPIHVVDEEHRWRKVQKDLHKKKERRGYYEPTYMTHGYHTLPAVLNWYKNRQDIYTNQSQTNVKKRSPTINRMADWKSPKGKEKIKNIIKRDVGKVGTREKNIGRSVADDKRDITRGGSTKKRDDGITMKGVARSLPLGDARNDDGFDDWQDLQPQELPPQDITVSPRPRKQPMNIDMVVMKGLVTAVSSAVDLILNHFSRTSEMGPQDKTILGDTLRTPVIGLLVLDHLCPAIANILKDGMKPYIRNYIIGRAKNSIWQVVEATTELGPGTRSLYELVCLIQEQKSLSTDMLKFNAFIFGLLSTKCLEVWLNHIRRHPDIVRTYYEKNAFLCQCSTSMNQFFNDLMVAVQPLSLLPFKLALDFELKYTQRQSYRTRQESFTSTDSQAFMSLPWLGRRNSQTKTNEEPPASWQSWVKPSSILGSLRLSKEQSSKSAVDPTELQKPDASWRRSKALLKTAIVGRDKASLKKRSDQVSQSLTHASRKTETEGVTAKDKTFQTQVNTVKHDSIPKTERNQIQEGVSTQAGSNRGWSIGSMTGAVSKKLYGEDMHKQDVRYPVVGADKDNLEGLQRNNQSEYSADEAYASTSMMNNIGTNVIKAFDYMLLPKQTPKEFQMVDMRNTRPQQESRRDAISPGEARKESMLPFEQTMSLSTEPEQQWTPISDSKQTSVKTRCHNVSMQQGFLSFSKGEVLQLKERIDSELLLCCRGQETGLVYRSHVKETKPIL